MTEKSKQYDSKASADAIEGNEPDQTAAETPVSDLAEEPLSTRKVTGGSFPRHTSATGIDPKAVEVKERVWGCLLSKNSPISVGISDMASKLHLTEEQASDALKQLDSEGKIALSMVRVTVAIQDSNLWS
jgi:hypothetical protein